MQNHQKHNRYFLLSLFTFIILASLITRGYVFPVGNHYTHIPQIKAMLNPELYTNDYYVREMLEFTPRFYYQFIIYALSKLTQSIAASYFIYYLLALSSFIIGSYHLGKLFNRSKLSAATMVFLSLTAYNLIGYVQIFPSRPVPAVFAMSLSIWGIYFGFRQRWLISYLFFGIASLLQFLVGALPALMMAPILAISSYKNRRFQQAILALPIFALMASLVYLPMVMAGNTSTDKISNFDFVFIYGWVRNPHHIIPSRWSFGIWLDFLLFIAGGVWCVKTTTSLPKSEKWKFYLIIAESIFALVLNYVFVEIYPLSLVAKLQLARTVPFAQLIIFIAASTQIDDFYKKGRLELGLLLLISLSFAWPYRGFLFLISSILLPRLERYKFQAWVAVGVSLIFCLISAIAPSKQILIAGFFAQPILFSILALPLILEKLPVAFSVKKIVAHALGLTTAVIFVLGLCNALPGKVLDIFQQQVKVYRLPQDDVTKLALRFSQISDKDALILVPPFVSNFQFFSERGAIANFKHFPQTDDGIKEWKSRMEAIFGKPLSPELAVGAMEIWFPQRSGWELTDVARKYGADYILTRVDWHGDIDGIVVDKEGEWIIYRIRRLGNNFEY